MISHQIRDAHSMLNPYMCDMVVLPLQGTTVLTAFATTSQPCVVGAPIPRYFGCPIPRTWIGQSFSGVSEWKTSRRTCIVEERLWSALCGRQAYLKTAGRCTTACYTHLAALGTHSLTGAADGTMDMQMSTCIRRWWLVAADASPLRTRRRKAQSLHSTQPPWFHRAAALASELALALAAAGHGLAYRYRPVRVRA